MRHTAFKARQNSTHDWRTFSDIRSMQAGKVGYILMWLLGVPLPLLVIWFLFFGAR